MLSASYFTGELLIPSISGSTYAEVENLALLNLMIKKYEVPFLKDLLGETLYGDYVAAMALSPTSGPWFDLDAQIYSEDSPLYKSPVANYVYCKFWKTAHTVTTQVGEMAGKIENADKVSIGQKMIDAWNDMVDMVEDIRDFLDENSADYTNWLADEVAEWEKMNQWGI